MATMDTGGRVTWPQLAAVLSFVGNAIFWGVLWILDERHGNLRSDVTMIKATQEQSQLLNARQAGIAATQCRFLRDLVRELKPTSVPYPCPDDRAGGSPGPPLDWEGLAQRQ